MQLGLEGRVALVCGASSGLGRAVAAELAAEGARVAICARRPEVLAQVAEALTAASGREVIALPADLSIQGEPTRVVQDCLAHYGRLDILVANGGGPPPGAFETLRLEQWEEASRLLLMSTVELVAAALPAMKEAHWGRILAITSIAASQPVDNLMLSNALRPAVAGFVNALAREVGRDGITANTILPGFTNTERIAELRQADIERGVDPSVREAELISEIPLGRFAEPAELAALAAFLVSERASYLTGSAFRVDGGWIRAAG